jgi:hypothetical protein
MIVWISYAPVRALDIGTGLSGRGRWRTVKYQTESPLQC